MEMFNNSVAVSYGEIVGNVVTETNYKSLKRRGQLKVIRRGCRGTEALIDYESMPGRLKKLVIERIGDPAKALKTNYLTKAIEHDTEARSFFNNYLTSNDEHLPANRITEYITNAEILNAIGGLVADKRVKRKVMGGRGAGLWDNMAATLAQLDTKMYPHSLPENPVRLRDKLNSYKKEGYYSLIHKGYGNKLAEKLSEPGKLWALARWANMVERVTSVEHLFALYNIEAEKQGWKQLESSGTLKNYLYSEGVQDLWWGYRYGELKSKEKFSMQHSTRLPSMRDSLWYSDGTKLNYFYLGESGSIETISVYEVMDSYSEVLLGYHISKSEDFEAQFKAYKMAVQVAGHRPYQIGFDNQGGHKKLENAGFLTKLAHLSIATTPYNGKSKTIESAFGRFQQQVLKRDWFFTGQNIQSKKDESKANMEFIMANKANLPSLEDIKALYQQRRQEWNDAPHPKTGTPRLEMYMNSFNAKSPAIDLIDMVDLFWMLRPEPVTLNAYGLSFTEKKIKYDYLVYRDGKPDQLWLRKNIDQKFWIKFDPDDMSIIYLYEKDATGLRFVTAAETKVTVARGKQEQEDFEAAYIAQVNAENKVIRQHRADEMDQILAAHGLLPEQNGLVTPSIKGIGKKKKRESAGFGKAQKALSNALPVDEISIYELM